MISLWWLISVFTTIYLRLARYKYDCCPFSTNPTFFNGLFVFLVGFLPRSSAQSSEPTSIANEKTLAFEAAETETVSTLKTENESGKCRAFFVRIPWDTPNTKASPRGSPFFGGYEVTGSGGPIGCPSVGGRDGGMGDIRGSCIDGSWKENRSGRWQGGDENLQQDDGRLRFEEIGGISFI